MSNTPNTLNTRSRLSRASKSSRASNVGALARSLQRQPAGLVEPYTIRLIQHYVGHELSAEDEHAIRTDFDRMDALIYNLNVVLNCLGKVEQFDQLLGEIQDNFDQNGIRLMELQVFLNRTLMYFPELLMRFGRRPQGDLFTISSMSSIMDELVRIEQNARRYQLPNLVSIQRWMSDIQQLIEEGKIIPEFVPEIRERNSSIEHELVEALNRIRH
jgi:hypothetical protein